MLCTVQSFELQVHKMSEGCIKFAFIPEPCSISSCKSSNSCMAKNSLFRSIRVIVTQDILFSPGLQILVGKEAHVLLAKVG